MRLQPNATHVDDHGVTYCRHLLWLSDGFISGHALGYHLLQASLEAHQIKNPSHIGTIHPERQSWVSCPQERNSEVPATSLWAWQHEKPHSLTAISCLIRHTLLAFFLSYLIFHSSLFLPDSSQINDLYSNHYLRICYWGKPT